MIADMPAPRGCSVSSVHAHPAAPRQVACVPLGDVRTQHCACFPLRLHSNEGSARPPLNLRPSCAVDVQSRHRHTARRVERATQGKAACHPAACRVCRPTHETKSMPVCVCAMRRGCASHLCCLIVSKCVKDQGGPHPLVCPHTAAGPDRHSRMGAPGDGRLPPRAPAAAAARSRCAGLLAVGG